MVAREDARRILEQAYRTHADYVFALCLRFAGGDRQWAIDRSHDVFLALNNHLSRLDLRDDLRPWLRKVAINECFLDLRRRERRQRLLRMFGRTSEASSSRPDAELSLARDVLALDGALGRLPARQRMLLGLMYFESESLTDAARTIGISKGQASKLHKAALAQLAALEWEGK